MGKALVILLFFLAVLALAFLLYPRLRRRIEDWLDLLDH